MGLNAFVIFMGCICALPILALALYPLWTYMRVWVHTAPVQVLHTEYAPPVSIVMAAYNEERFILQKMNALLNADEWIDGSELIVVSSGSTDGTNALLEKYRSHPQVRLMINTQHFTKIQGVNQAVALSKNDILVFCDCRQILKKGAIRQLVKHFQNDEVGTVNGTLIDNKDGLKGSWMRNLLNQVALNESVYGSSLNIFGALYAQRKSVYRPIPTDILFDDLFVTVSTLALGKKLIQEKEAVIYDVNFTQYYNRERIERLTRGLLVFLHNHHALVGELPLWTRLRFLLYKYIKIMLPFLALIMAACLVYWAYPLFSQPVGVWLLVIPALLLAFRKSRTFVVLMLRVNLYTGLATLAFVFLKRRSIRWQKLTPNQLRQQNP